MDNQRQKKSSQESKALLSIGDAELIEKQRMFEIFGADGLTMFQRAAHEFQVSIFEEAKEIFPTYTPYDVKLWADSGLDKKESQGVTPLLIASSTRDSHMLEQREQFITYLIKDCHASVTCMHSVTKWTPLHWIARYGDIELCKLMLEFDGDAFTPDHKGYFPIDYAGYFNHEKMVKVLVEHSIEKYKKSVERYKTAKATPEKIYKSKVQENLFVHSEKFLNSPFYATRLLFWACHCQFVNAQDVKFILDQMESYPEAQIKIYFDQTSIHAAAACGDPIKMNLVCLDYYNRHQENKIKYLLKQKIMQSQRKASKKKFTMQAFTRKPNQNSNLYSELLEVMKLKSVQKFKLQADKMWENLTQTYRRSVSFNIQDFQGNTPLHLSSLNNKVECTKLLLEEYGCYVDIKSKQGIMANDIGNWHPEIKKIYDDFYLKMDRMLAENKVGDDQEMLRALGGRQENVDSADFLMRAISKVKGKLPLTKELLKSRPFIPYCPPVAMKFQLRTKGCCRKGKNYTTQMNVLLRELDSAQFIFRIFKGVNNPFEYIVTLDLKMETIISEMFENQKHLKLQYFNTSVAFTEDLRTKLIPFMSKDIQKCIINKFDKLFDINSLKKNCGLLMIYPLHDNQGLNYIEECRNKKCEQEQSCGIKADDKSKFSHLISMKHYFGSKIALLYAFFGYQSIILILPSLFAIAITAYQLTQSQMVPKPDTPSMYAKLKDFVKNLLNKHTTDSQQSTSTPTLQNPISIDPVESTISTDPLESTSTDPQRLLGDFVCTWYDFVKCTPELQSTQLNVLFAIFMSFWVVICQELWKRREKEIQYAFGMLSQNTEQIREDIPNPEYIGQNVFSWSSFKVRKESYKPFTGCFFFFLSLVCSAVLIACTFVAYYFLKVKTTGIWQGVALTVITMVTNFLFQKSLIYFERKINFKMLQKQKQFFVNQTLVFRLLNYNIPVVFALIWQKADQTQQQKYLAMYTLIIGLVGTKSFIYLTKYLTRALKFYLAKALYFMKVNSLAKKQAESYKMTDLLLDGQERDALNKRQGLHIYKDVLPTVGSDSPQPAQRSSCCNRKQKSQIVAATKNDGQTIEMSNKQLIQSDSLQQREQVKNQSNRRQPLCYQRLVTNNFNDDNDCIENIQIDVDLIEINSRMPLLNDHEQAIDMAEKYNILACALFYCGICPITVFIIMVFFFLDNFFKMHSNCYIMQRKLTDAQKDLGSWNVFADSIVIVTIVTNSLLLLVSDTSYENVLETLGEVTKSDSRRIWIVVGVEHLVIFLLILIRALVPDISTRLRMCLQRTAFELEKLGLQNSQASQADKARIAELEAKVKSLEGKQKNQIHEGRLVEFLGINPKQQNYEKIIDACDQSLITNMEMRLFRETFNIIERSIIQRKLNKIIEANKMLTVICVECQTNCADIFCGDCNDHYCRVCFSLIHKNKLYAKHQTRNLNLNPTDAIKAATKTTNALSAGDVQWVKFEYFSFPSDATNDHYKNLQMHFENLKKAYVKYNYIDEFTGKIDLASVFVDQNYDGIERELGRVMLSDHTKKFGRRNLVAQKEIVDGGMWFNDEELYYLNRIAYQLFQKWGSRLKFELFISEINKLQSNSFDTRLTTWLKLVQELEEDVGAKYKVGKTADINLTTDFISRVKFGNVVRASYPQHVEMKKSFEKVVDQVYNNGLDSILSVRQVFTNIKSKPDALALMHCVLQWKGVDENLRSGVSIASTKENQV